MMMRNSPIRRVATLTAALFLVGAHASFAGSNRVWYRTVEIDGQTIFYREAGGCVPLLVDFRRGPRADELNSIRSAYQVRSSV